MVVVSFPEYLNSTLSHLRQSDYMLQSPIEVKISGDGAPFYRSTSFIILSFSFPPLDPDSLSSTGMPSLLLLLTYYTGTHVLSIIQGEGKYELFKNVIALVIDDVNSIMNLKMHYKVGYTIIIMLYSIC